MQVLLFNNMRRIRRVIITYHKNKVINDAIEYAIFCGWSYLPRLNSCA
ncbi:hypothetical protein NT01EI_2551 [Edwardsiella ictaluri 93-146]|uniref:Uncharacterized protein n=1 Tax=Edwardsiella ictaluri (strain 93-146) TaxID=634503 RepID=C5BFZ2_EDWI9|nr:hypothetical protein NT01EI_2551 [Edwardsiella ictaluri 93-146]